MSYSIAKEKEQTSIAVAVGDTCPIFRGIFSFRRGLIVGTRGVVKILIWRGVLQIKKRQEKQQFGFNRTNTTELVIISAASEDLNKNAPISDRGSCNFKSWTAMRLAQSLFLGVQH